ncbi:MAG: PH domain-containing protein [Bacilli bacterium]
MIEKKFTFYSKTEITPQLEELLSPKEQIAFALKTVRDVAVFTNKRILICDKQGITGKKVEYFTIPYSRIVTYSIETAGTFDIDAEIKLQLSSNLFIELEFVSGKNLFSNKESSAVIFDVASLIDNAIL